MLFNLLLVIVFLEFFTDPITKIYTIVFRDGDPIVKTVITSLFFLIFVFGIRSFPKITNLWLPFWIIITVVSYGVFRGLLTNVPYNVLNDASSYLALFLIPAIIGFKVEDREIEIKKFLKILIYLMLVKIIAFEMLTMALVGAPSWKILLKQTPLLLIPFSVYLSDILSNKKKYLLLVHFAF